MAKEKKVITPPESPVSSGLKKVKATRDEVLAYQEKGVLYGSDPANGIAWIKDAPVVGFKYHQPAE